MNWLRFLFGYVYLVNTHTREVHNLRRERGNCRIDLISPKNQKFVKRARAEKLIAGGNFNGCRWCMGESDTDTW